MSFLESLTTFVVGAALGGGVVWLLCRTKTPSGAAPLEQSSFGVREHQVIEALQAPLRDHVELSRLAFNLILHALSSVPQRPIDEVPQATKVAVALMIRIGNDLRAATLLAVRGYPLQAAASTASLVEIAHTLVWATT